MMKDLNLKNKLLSHRLRGFSDIEQSPSALNAASFSQIKYLEIDTRVSQDGKIFVYHDPAVGNEVDGSFVFAKTNSLEIRKKRYINGEPILTLNKTLKIFAEMKDDYQYLCIDIKDFGFEEIYLNAIKEYNLERSVIFISWIPQTLSRLYELKAKSPLILSHLNTTKFKIFGNILSQILKNRTFRISRMVFMGKESYSSEIKKWQQGYRHGYICQKLPQAVIKILSKSRGGICVHRSLINRNLVNYCMINDLKLWIFDVINTKQFVKYAKDPGIHVVFCDNALKVFNDLVKKEKNIPGLDPA